MFIKLDKKTAKKILKADAKINTKVKKSDTDLFRLLSEELVSLSVSRDFKIELQNGDTITVNKWMTDGVRSCIESDWDFEDGESQAIYDKMSEDNQDLFYDFVQGLQVIK